MLENPIKKVEGPQVYQTKESLHISTQKVPTIKYTSLDYINNTMVEVSESNNLISKINRNKTHNFWIECRITKRLRFTSKRSIDSKEIDCLFCLRLVEGDPIVDLAHEYNEPIKKITDLGDYLYDQCKLCHETLPSTSIYVFRQLFTCAHCIFKQLVRIPGIFCGHRQFYTECGGCYVVEAITLRDKIKSSQRDYEYGGFHLKTAISRIQEYLTYLRITTFCSICKWSPDIIRVTMKRIPVCNNCAKRFKSQRVVAA